MNEGVLEDQKQGKFHHMSERDKEIQASIWALIFLASEQALAFRMLRNRLKDKGVLDDEDEAWINQNTIRPEALQAAYAHVETAFEAKYERARYALEHPEQLTAEYEQRERMKQGYSSTSKGEEELAVSRKNSSTTVTRSENNPSEEEGSRTPEDTEIPTQKTKGPKNV